MYSPSTLQRVLERGGTNIVVTREETVPLRAGGRRPHYTVQQQAPGPRGGATFDWRPGAACSALGVMLAALLVVASVSIGSVAPTSFGLRASTLSGFVKTDKVYAPGLYFIGPLSKFIEFPTTQQTIAFDDRRGLVADGAPIQTRTGQDRNDPDSGGQPIKICVALQYVLQRQHVGDMYLAFGSAYQARHALLARNTIANIAQQFEPTEFWTRRERVAEAMFTAVDETIRTQGHARVTRLQLLRVDFPDQYEDMITQIQLQVQARTTKEYTQQVVDVYKHLDIMRAETDATVLTVTADAARAATEHVGAVRAEGFAHVAAATAGAVRAVGDALGLNGDELVQLRRIKSVRQHREASASAGGGATVVVIDDPFSVPY